MKKNKVTIVLAVAVVVCIVLLIGAYGGFDGSSDKIVCTEHMGGHADCQQKAKCAVCGEEYGKLGEHVEVAGDPVEATCTTPGLTQVIKCDICEKILKAEKKTPAKGHSWKEVAETAPTCDKNGCTSHKVCTECGETEGKEIIPAAHDFSVTIMSLPETCTKDGYTTYKVCSMCKAEDGTKIVIPATHIFTVDVPALPETCDEDGYTAHKKCSRCDETEGKIIIPAAHKFTVDVPTLPETCFADGYTAHKICSECGEEDGTKQIIPAAHKFTVDVAEKPATCYQDGYTAHKACSECGLDNGTKAPILAAHTWTEHEGYRSCFCGAYKITSPASLQQVINNASTGDTIELAAGAYSPFVIQNADGTPKDGVTIVGENGVIFSHIDLNGSDDIVIKGITFDASLAVMGNEYYSNLSFYNASSQKSSANVLIEDCSFVGTPVDAGAYVPICADERGSGLRLSDITIKNCDFLAPSLYCIYLPYAAKGTVTLTNNTFKDFSMYAISLMRNQADLVATGNTFIFTARADMGTSAAIMSSSRHESSTHLITATITNNTFTTEEGVENISPKFAVFNKLYTKDNFSITFEDNIFSGLFEGITNDTLRVVYPRY